MTDLNPTDPWSQPPFRTPEGNRQDARKWPAESDLRARGEPQAPPGALPPDWGAAQTGGAFAPAGARYQAGGAPQRALLERGDAFAEAGDFDRAERCYRQAATLAPDAAAPHVRLGTAYLQTDRLDRAEEAFAAARQAEADCAEAYGGLAMVHQRRGEYPAALEMYLRCLELDSDNLVALLGLFQTSCQMGTFDRITHFLELYLGKHPRDASVLFCLATLYAREHKFVEAREVLAELVRIEPDRPEAAGLMRAVEDRLAPGLSRQARP